MDESIVAQTIERPSDLPDDVNDILHYIDALNHGIKRLVDLPLSLRLILESGVNYEFRTTVAPALLSAQALKELAQLLAKLGVRNYVLQEFRTQGCANAAVQDADSYHTDSYCQSIAPMFRSFAVRRALNARAAPRLVKSPYQGPDFRSDVQP